MGGDSVLKCFILMNDDEYSCIESNDMMMMNEYLVALLDRIHLLSFFCREYYFLIYVWLNSLTTSRVRECMVHKSCICAYQTPPGSMGGKVFFLEKLNMREEKRREFNNVKFL